MSWCSQILQLVILVTWTPEHLQLGLMLQWPLAWLIKSFRGHFYIDKQLNELKLNFVFVFVFVLLSNFIKLQRNRRCEVLLSRSWGQPQVGFPPFKGCFNRVPSMSTKDDNANILKITNYHQCPRIKIQNVSWW